jgi:peptidyl-prolyl cis-trans isomerase SurA
LKSAPNLTNGKTNSEILDVFRQAVAFEYYKEHLEKYNPLFAAQINEFRDGNLLFEIMQRQVWNRASADSDGLKKYFEVNAKNYWWKSGAEAIIFTAPNVTSAKKLKIRLEGNMGDWRKIVDSLAGQAQADSGRFEIKQIPLFNRDADGRMRGKAGGFTPPQTNADKSVQFAYIIHKYSAPSPRTFDEARGLVITDYQNELENKWVEELKKKYPVTIIRSVFKTLPKKA